MSTEEEVPAEEIVEEVEEVEEEVQMSVLDALKEVCYSDSNVPESGTCKS